MGRTLFLIWAVLVIVWTASIVSLNPNHVSNSNFWFMVMWINFLISLNLYVSAPVLSIQQERNSSRLIGSLPSINLIIFFFSILSGPFAFFNYFASPDESIKFFYNYHFVIQLFLSGLVAIACLFLVLASQGAESGARDLPTREDLIKRLKNFELMNEDIKANSSSLTLFENLLDHIEYKMPHPSALDRDAFLSLSNEIDKLDDSTGQDSKEIENRLDALYKMTKSL
tara:strand:+ start:1057 stop:1737 length:681 start_codon:yes stop_codon:yes gene_type:complete